MGDRATEGSDEAYVDLGPAVVLSLDEIAGLRRQLMASLTEDDWSLARAGFGDSELATE